MVRFKPEAFSGKFKTGQVVRINKKNAIILYECNEIGYYCVIRKEKETVYVWKVFGGEISPYRNHCWHCENQLIDSRDKNTETCPECHWVICPECGACKKPDCEPDNIIIGNPPLVTAVEDEDELL